MGTLYIVVEHTRKEYIDTTSFAGYSQKRREWMGSHKSLMLLGLAMDRWAMGAYNDNQIEWVGLDDDSGYKYMEEYKDITKELIAGFNSDHVITDVKTGELFIGSLWYDHLFKLEDGSVPTDFENVRIDRPPRPKRYTELKCELLTKLKECESLVEKDLYMARNEVKDFAAQMERKLAEHDDRPGWKECDILWLLKRLREETDEIEEVIKKKGDGWLMKLFDECADVGNFAMMIHDAALWKWAEKNAHVFDTMRE